MKAWHFLPENGKCRWGRHGKIVAGKTLRVAPPLEMCSRGFHASKRLLDALDYAPGPIVCRVECGGEIIHDSDKLVAEKRTVLWMYDCSLVLHEFACRCAEDALASIDNPDPRSLEAVRIKRLWIMGEATARDAAWDAARTAAGDAAGDAARTAAGDAAGDAAWAAVRTAQNRRLTSMVVSNQP